jgi:hypothetical protein
LRRGPVPVHGRTEPIDESNYAQLKGLHGGENTITVKVEGFGAKPLVPSVSVLPGSGLYETPRGPSALSLRVSRSLRIASGETIRLPITLLDSGDDARGTSASRA